MPLRHLLTGQSLGFSLVPRGSRASGLLQRNTATETHHPHYTPARTHAPLSVHLPGTKHYVTNTLSSTPILFRIFSVQSIFFYKPSWCSLAELKWVCVLWPPNMQQPHLLRRLACHLPSDRFPPMEVGAVAGAPYPWRRVFTYEQCCHDLFAHTLFSSFLHQISFFNYYFLVNFTTIIYVIYFKFITYVYSYYYILFLNTNTNLYFFKYYLARNVIWFKTVFSIILPPKTMIPNSLNASCYRLFKSCISVSKQPYRRKEKLSACQMTSWNTDLLKYSGYT